ncbi:MAG TPA: phospholipase A [Rhizobacter sp.]|nr:phospholipase A [Rhizobacter sp.]
MLVLLCTAASPAAAQAEPSAALAKCAEIGAAADRLACYDRLAGRAAAEPATPLPAEASASAPPSTSALLPVDTAHMQATAPAAPASLLSRFWELDRADKRGVFNFIGYQPNYILPLHFTSHINRSPQSPTQAAVLLPDYQRVEAKVQLSLRTKVAQGVLLHDADVWFGYTQQSLWQVWNSTDSKPFRNTDYEAEMMYVVPLPERLRQLPFGWLWRYGQVALAHQSNGQADPLSRSWNRTYVAFGFERGDWSLIPRFNQRIRENIADDNNPDITDYRGRGDLQLNWASGIHTASLLYRTTFKRGSRGALQFDFTTPVYRHQPNGIRWFLELFSGYGETLTDYNFRQNSLGLGVTFLQF